MAYSRKIYLLIAAFVALHLVLFFGFYFFAEKRNDLIQNFKKFKVKESVNMLFLGDSHVVRGIDINSFDNVASLAYYGQNNIMSYYQLMHCVEKGYAKPRYVILPCDLITFSKGANVFRTNKFYYYAFIPFSELKNFEDDGLSAYYRYIKLKVVPYAEWRSGLGLNNTNRQVKGKNRFSDLPEHQQMEEARFFIQTEMNCAEDSSNLFYKGSLIYLKKTIDLCKQENIKLIFVKFPATKVVLEEVKNHVDPHYLISRPSETIINQYNIPILDFEKDFLMKEYLFFDCHHLNDSGKVVFTNRFKEKLDSLSRIY